MLRIYWDLKSRPGSRVVMLYHRHRWKMSFFEKCAKITRQQATLLSNYQRHPKYPRKFLSYSIMKSIESVIQSVPSRAAVMSCFLFSNVHVEHFQQSFAHAVLHRIISLHSISSPTFSRYCRPIYTVITQPDQLHLRTKETKYFLSLPKQPKVNTLS